METEAMIYTLVDIDQFTTHEGVFDRKSFNQHGAARIFGHLLKVATPIIQYYHSDLYYDSLLIGEKLDQWDTESPVTWVWGVRETGTDMSDTHVGFLDGRAEVVFDCTLRMETRSWGNGVAMFEMKRTK